MHPAKFSSEDIDALAIAIARALQQAHSVSDSEHYDHHQWITKKMKAEEWRAEFWEKMVEHVTKWGAISIISAIGYALYLGFMQEMKK